MGRVFPQSFHSRFLLLLFLAPVMPAARACDYCLLSQGISPLQTQHGKGLSITERYTRLDTVYDRGHEIPNPGTKEQYWTTQILGFWSPADRWQLSLNIPIRVTRGDGDLERLPGGDLALDPASGSATGIGDVALLARYTLFERHSLTSTLQLAISAGAQFPTGATDRHNDEGEFLDAHLEPGTGAFNALAGFAANYVFARVSLSANGLASFPGKGKFGHTDYQFGNSLNWNLTGRYRLFPAEIGGNPQVFLAFGMAGELRGREREDGVSQIDTGGHTLYAVPGIQVVYGGWVMEASLYKGIDHALNGVQLGEDYKALATFTHLF